jgi:hypothetical protein
MIRCREIATADAVADCLARGFAARSRNYWVDGLRRQSERQVPDGFPRFAPDWQASTGSHAAANTSRGAAAPQACRPLSDAERVIHGP